MIYWLKKSKYLLSLFLLISFNNSLHAAELIGSNTHYWFEYQGKYSLNSDLGITNSLGTRIYNESAFKGYRLQIRPALSYKLSETYKFTVSLWYHQLRSNSNILHNELRPWFGAKANFKLSNTIKFANDIRLENRRIYSTDASKEKVVDPTLRYQISFPYIRRNGKSTFGIGGEGFSRVGFESNDYVFNRFRMFTYFKTKISSKWRSNLMLVNEYRQKNALQLSELSHVQIRLILTHLASK